MFILFYGPLTFFKLVGGLGGQGRIKIASASTPSASTPSANEPVKGLILVHTVKLKPMIKSQISERMVSSCINDLAFASVYSDKTRVK